MQFVRTTEPEATAALLQRVLSELQAGRRVLWLVSGGSNIPVSVQVMHELPDELSQLLTVSLIDERYGLVGHADSNAKQLFDAGFTVKQGTFLPVLSDDSLTVAETAERFGAAIQAAFGTADVVIGQLGMGTDGHIAGILPDSPAVEAKGWVTHYESNPYNRITLTFDALRAITASYTFCWGDTKRVPLEQLRDTETSLNEQPAQILKTLSEAYVYNDQIESQE